MQSKNEFKKLVKMKYLDNRTLDNRDRDPLYFSGLMIMDICFLVLSALESVNKWRLSTMKVLLALFLILFKIHSAFSDSH